LHRYVQNYNITYKELHSPHEKDLYFISQTIQHVLCSLQSLTHHLHVLSQPVGFSSVFVSPPLTQSFRPCTKSGEIPVQTAGQNLVTQL
jgi:hypothetical protein